MARRRIGVQRRRRIRPVRMFVFLDEDQAVLDLRRAERARRIAELDDITIIWQRPCFEALLLRHFPGRASDRPTATAVAGRALEREWPGYRKPMPRAALTARIDIAAVRRAAAVEPELAELLRTMGLLS